MKARTVKIVQSKLQRENSQKMLNRACETARKHHITGILEGEERESMIEKILNNWNFQILAKDIHLQIQELEQTLSRINSKESTEINICIKVKLVKTKDKEKSLESNQNIVIHTYKGKSSLKDCRFFIRKYKDQKEAVHISGAKRKNLSM